MLAPFWKGPGRSERSTRAVRHQIARKGSNEEEAPPGPRGAGADRG
jgi:hypothetical protein